MRVVIKDNFGVWEKDEFVITDNVDFVIEFENLDFSEKKYLICELRRVKKTFEIIDNKVILPKEFVKVGVFKGVIEIREEEIAVKKIRLDDLKIIRLDNDFSAVPEIKQCRDEVAVLSNKVEVLTELVEQLTESVESLLTIEIGE